MLFGVYPFLFLILFGQYAKSQYRLIINEVRFYTIVEPGLFYWLSMGVFQSLNRVVNVQIVCK